MQHTEHTNDTQATKHSHISKAGSKTEFETESSNSKLITAKIGSRERGRLSQGTGFRVKFALPCDASVVAG